MWSILGCRVVAQRTTLIGPSPPVGWRGLWLSARRACLDSLSRTRTAHRWGCCVALSRHLLLSVYACVRTYGSGCHASRTTLSSTFFSRFDSRSTGTVNYEELLNNRTFKVKTIRNPIRQAIRILTVFCVPCLPSTVGKRVRQLVNVRQNNIWILYIGTIVSRC